MEYLIGKPLITKMTNSEHEFDLDTVFHVDASPHEFQSPNVIRCLDNVEVRLLRTYFAAMHNCQVTEIQVHIS